MGTRVKIQSSKQSIPCLGAILNRKKKKVQKNEHYILQILNCCEEISTYLQYFCIGSFISRRYTKSFWLRQFFEKLGPQDEDVLVNSVMFIILKLS